MDRRKILIIFILTISLVLILFRKENTQWTSIIPSVSKYHDVHTERRKHYKLKDGEFDVLPSGSPTIAAYEVEYPFVDFERKYCNRFICM
jgi:hypothetical protein